MNVNELNVLKTNAQKIRDAIRTERGRLQTWAQDAKLHQEEMNAAAAKIAELKEQLKAAEIAVKSAEIELIAA